MNITNRIRKTAGGWYMRLPQIDATVIVIGNINKRLKGIPLPCEREQLERLIGAWVATPKGQRLSTKREQRSHVKSKSGATVYMVRVGLRAFETYWEREEAVIHVGKEGELEIYADESTQAKVRAAMAADGIEIAKRRKKSDQATDVDALLDL